MSKTAKIVVSVKNAVCTIRFNDPKRYNAWSQQMMDEMASALRSAGEDDSVKAAILTGTGDYYCSGVDLAGSLQMMRPSAFLRVAKEKNQALFENFINFPKPLIAAVNGPAIGASVTSASLCDAVLAADGASFHTPFRQLGIPPEGCSSWWFPRQLGEAGARVMLEEGRRVSASEAAGFGLATSVVPKAQLMEEAQRLAEEWAATGRRRILVEQEVVEKLKQVNAEESERLARAFMSDPFLDAMMEFTTSKGKTQASWAFWLLKNTRPLWSRLQLPAR